MIYDCFLFFNELEILDIRLNELNSVVDKFVLVEATVTHTNQSKPLYYQENRDRFKQFHKKIIHIIVDDSPNVSMTWIIERYQSTQVMQGLKRCRPNDVILYSNVDEIPKAEKILFWKNRPGKNKVFKQDKCWYFLNCVQKERGIWNGTRMLLFKDLKKFKDIYLVRYLKPDMEIADGGWHFSWMGGVKKFQKKLSSFTHQELNKDSYNTPEKIKQAMIEGKDPFGFNLTFRILDVEFLPKYVRENHDKFKKMLATKSVRKKWFYKLEVTMWKIVHILRIYLLRKIKRRLKVNLTTSS